MGAEGALVVFGRLPVPGQAKTRLAPALGAERAADLQRRLLRRALATAVAAGGMRITFCHDGGADAATDGLVPAGVEVRAQHGADLGERMQSALAGALAKHPWAMLVGTDCPARTPAELRWAAARLAGGDDVVLGPVLDGGYSLIGLRRPQPRLFQDLHWSTRGVAAATRARLRAGGLAWSELMLSWDLDVPADLARLDRLQPPLD